MSDSVVIVGGSVVGMSLSLALAKRGIQSIIIEARPAPTSLTTQDIRAFALSLSSQKLYQTLDVWPKLANITTIKQIHISEQNRYGYARLNADDFDEPLGYIVNAYEVLNTLYAACQNNPLIQIQHQSKVISLSQQASDVQIQLEKAGARHSMYTQLLFACDGGNSSIAQQLNINYDETFYEQTAISATLKVQLRKPGIAYERFTEQGPLALLPLTNQHYGLVWTHHDDQAKEMMALSDEDFLQQLQLAFGQRLGRFSQLSQRFIYPLNMRLAQTQVSGRCVLMGNSAHSLHPAAGQGLNLALRDVAYFVAMIGDKQHIEQDLLDNYQQARQADQDFVCRGTDRLVRLFSNNIPGLGLARAVGLSLFDLLPVKHPFIERATYGIEPAIHDYVKLESA